MYIHAKYWHKKAKTNYNAWKMYNTLQSEILNSLGNFTFSQITSKLHG